MEAGFLGLVILSTLLPLPSGQTVKTVHPSDLCAGMECRHESPCKTVVTRTGSKETLTAQCECQDVWIGPRCEAEVRLASHIISSATVEIIIQFHIPDSNQAPGEENADDFFHNFLKYSLHYWRNDTRDSCSVIPHLTATRHVINSLVPDTLYYFCVEPNKIDLCYPLRTTSDLSSLPGNCLSVRTRDIPVLTNAPGHLVPVTLTVVVLLAVVILSIPFLRKYNSCHCMTCRATPSQSGSSRKFEQTNNGAQEMLLLPPMSPAKLPNVSAPSSPGRPKHKLSRRARGYASFATKNSQRIALTTVVEYTPDDDV
ncbi:hypothetical protein ScPMuIL_010723 [Solemya velum]